MRGKMIVRKFKGLLPPFLLFLLLTLVLDALPRVFPTPSSPHAFDGREVLFLQEHLSGELSDRWWVAVYSFGYLFLIYATAAFLLFFEDVEAFKEYFWIFAFCQLLGFLTWFFFPVSPPRLAIPEVRDVREELFGLTERFNAFPHGAFPSLHAANGFLAFFFVRRHGKGPSLVWGVSWILLMFSTLYLGEHYWQDLVAGCLYAFLSLFFLLRPFRKVLEALPSPTRLSR
ncbi:MAG: phosphatase PAP2 family protein [Candidatus Hadarchaeales archaeon]